MLCAHPSLKQKHFSQYINETTIRLQHSSLCTSNLWGQHIGENILDKMLLYLILADYNFDISECIRFMCTEFEIPAATLNTQCENLLHMYNGSTAGQDHRCTKILNELVGHSKKYILVYN